jgi:hypothetical protein
VAEHERPAVGSVAEEVARLLDALGGWASTAQTTYAAQPAARHTSPSGSESADSSAAESGGKARCEACGAANGVGQAVVCQLCPVCQGIGLLRSVRPETVDRLADLAGAVAATLRDIATQHRGDAQEQAREPRTGASRVQDIRIEDEDYQPEQEPSQDRAQEPSQDRAQDRAQDQSRQQPHEPGSATS